MSLLARMASVLDVRAGLIGATLMAAIVFWINSSHGAFGASTAAAKQWVFTFFVGAFLVQLSTRLAVRPGRSSVSIGLAILVPSLTAVGLTFLLHSAKGTPRPLASTVPVLLISSPSFLGWALRARRASEAGVTAWERLPAKEKS
ncbi:MAG: hypothetical protein JRH10_22175 [Deltaproteobacteria bacterium]|nr:hypothetical protein [Deltaproteobacteria bacterium]